MAVKMKADLSGILGYKPLKKLHILDKTFIWQHLGNVDTEVQLL